MRILVVAQVVDETHPILGFFVDWLRAFAEEAEEVTVVAQYVGSYTLPDNVTVHSLGKERGYSKLRQLVLFYRLFGRGFFSKPSHVFFHMGAVFTLVAIPFSLIRKVFGVRFFWWKAHGHIGWRERASLWFVDRVVTSTDSGFPLETRKRRVVGQAINTDRFTSGETRSHTKDVLYVGRISPVKHLEVLAEVAAMLQGEGFRFTVVGPAADEDYMTELESQFTAAGVTYRGALAPEELPVLYRSHTYFLNPSLTHSMDKTVLEAVLCGSIPLTANHAFESLLQPYDLYVTEQSAATYAGRLRSLAGEDTAAISAALVSTVKAEHSLASFVSRVFTT